MAKPIRVLSIIDLVILLISDVLLSAGYFTTTPGSVLPNSVFISLCLSTLILGLVLITMFLAMAAARQNRQYGWFFILLLLLVIGVPGSYIVFLVFAGTAGANLAAQYGLVYLLVYTLCPLSAALGALIYSFRADLYVPKWETSHEPERPVNKWEPTE